MAWDLALNDNYDLTGGLVTGSDEIIQRVKLRLYRIMGEWFLNLGSGLPWYESGAGILGAPKNKIDLANLMIRQCILETTGVERIMDFQHEFLLGTRTLTIQTSLLLDTGIVEEMSLTFDAAELSGE